MITKDFSKLIVENKTIYDDFLIKICSNTSPLSKTLNGRRYKIYI